MALEQSAGGAGAPLPAGFGEVGGALLQGHENLAARRGITPAQMEGLFNVSYERYLVGDYEAAARGFELLCLYDHENLKYLQGYGYCLQALRNYPKAAICWHFSAMLMQRGSSEWAEACLNAARLFAGSGARQQARTVVQSVLEALPDTDSAARTQALALGQALSDA
ncbi:MAG: tetratricopeptide repeat protein [Gammaproteobacteria bacterium]|nr:tetratricopeptide repeat protein [Gammaproteobacteria bacterium]